MTDVPEASRTRRSYDAVAAPYAAQVRDELQDKPLDRGLLDAFVELTLGTVVLDVGCGPGHVTAALADRGAIAIGCDLSPQMCALAHEVTSLPFCSATMTALAARCRRRDRWRRVFVRGDAP